MDIEKVMVKNIMIIGIFYYANGTIHEGNWMNGEKNGKGLLKWANGTEY